MKISDFQLILHRLEVKGSNLFSVAEIGMMLSEKGETLSSSIKRSVRSGYLKKVANGLYANALTKNNEDMLYKVAAKLRPGEINYLSNESVLCNLSIISQQMLDRITVMTTGRSGIFKTPYGVVEFTHTKRNSTELVKQLTKVKGIPILFANKQIAVRDLKRIGRNVNMIDWEEFRESE